MTEFSKETGFNIKCEDCGDEMYYLIPDGNRETGWFETSAKFKRYHRELHEEE